MPGGYPAIDITAPDDDLEVLCAGCSRLTIQIANQPVYITFGEGTGMPLYGEPEPYLPTVGQLLRQFDAFKIRAKIPAASLPAGAVQAHVYLTPLV